jgi:nucleoside phosphorylase
MAASAWGLARPETVPAPPCDNRRVKKIVSPAAHKGIVWLHASAIAVWLLVAATLGALLLAGKAVPPVVVMAGLAAAAGHGLFLGAHLFLASRAAKRLAALAKDQPPAS